MRECVSDTQVCLLHVCAPVFELRNLSRVPNAFHADSETLNNIQFSSIFFAYFNCRTVHILHIRSSLLRIMPFAEKAL